MAKRFTDTDKWRQPWFRKLSAEGKTFWQFLTENVDTAGFWEKDYELATFLCNFEVNDQTLPDINGDKERVIDHGKYLQIVGFTDFQYGELTDKCKPHRPIIALVEKYKKKGYRKGFKTLQEKEKDKEKDKKKIYPDDFVEFWKLYPKRVGKQNALAQWKKLTAEEKKAVLDDIPRRKRDRKWIGEDGKTFIKDPERYLKHRQWEDEIIRVDGEVEDKKKPSLRPKLKPDGSPVTKNGAVVMVEA